MHYIMRPMDLDDIEAYLGSCTDTISDLHRQGDQIRFKIEYNNGDGSRCKAAIIIGPVKMYLSDDIILCVDILLYETDKYVKNALHDMKYRQSGNNVRHSKRYKSYESIIDELSSIGFLSNSLNIKG